VPESGPGNLHQEGDCERKKMYCGKKSGFFASESANKKCRFLVINATNEKNRVHSKTLLQPPSPILESTTVDCHSAMLKSGKNHPLRRAAVPSEKVESRGEKGRGLGERENLVDEGRKISVRPTNSPLALAETRLLA